MKKKKKTVSLWDSAMNGSLRLHVLIAQLKGSLWTKLSFFVPVTRQSLVDTLLKVGTLNNAHVDDVISVLRL